MCAPPHLQTILQDDISSNERLMSIQHCEGSQSWDVFIL